MATKKKETNSRSRATAVSDEEITAALLANGTIIAAAQALGIGQRTIYDRMNTNDFIAVYSAAKADLLRAALVNVNSRVAAAINTVGEIMENPELNAATRLQAAQTIINTAAKFAERLEAQEKKGTEAANAFPFDFGGLLGS